jgi:hypothetical protein
MVRFIMLAMLSGCLLTSTGCRLGGLGGQPASPLGGTAYTPNTPGAPNAPIDSSGQIPGTAPLAPSTVNFAPTNGAPAAPGSTAATDPAVAQLNTDTNTQ